MATRNITLQTKRLNKKWDLSPEELGRAAPNIEADTHFSPICIASLASQLWLLTKNRAVLSMHVGFVDTQYYNFFLCILPIAELHARTRRVSVAPYLRKCGNLPIRENLVIKWPYARLSSPTHFIGWLFVGLIYCTLDLRLFLANSNKINPNNGINEKFLMSLCYFSFSTPTRSCIKMGFRSWNVKKKQCSWLCLLKLHNIWIKEKMASKINFDIPIWASIDYLSALL